jgi:hypothetical protein
MPYTITISDDVTGDVLDELTGATSAEMQEGFTVELIPSIQPQSSGN